MVNILQEVTYYYYFYNKIPVFAFWRRTGKSVATQPEITVAILSITFLRGDGPSTVARTIYIDGHSNKNVINPASTKDIATKNYVYKTPLLYMKLLHVAI